ncbi:MAG TPA: hypothetical protein VJM14_03940 [Burkholderiales bacterium]|nr:hypothetical protein [Burkholderiales bacterium]
MRRLVAPIAACALAIAAAAPAAASQLLDVAVINRTTGQRVPVHTHQGRLYVAGTPGERYAVHIANRTGARVLAAVSVDGINVITGETASPDQDGYVLAPHQSFEIAGWRKSTSEVAAFYFTQLPDSYAARTDRPDHVGVIGVAVFREWTPPRPAATPWPRPLARGDGAARESESRAADAAEAPAAAEAKPWRDEMRRHERIGTGHGERERSEVVYTDFRRATERPGETITIYYDTRANLIARGILPRPTPVVAPNPFPAGRFVPDPRS